MYRRSSWPDIGDEHGCLGTLSPPVTATRSLTASLVSSEWLEVATWVHIRLDERYASGIIFFSSDEVWAFTIVSIKERISRDYRTALGKAIIELPLCGEYLTA